jgi:hypothetical protein
MIFNRGFFILSSKFNIIKRNLSIKSTKREKNNISKKANLNYYHILFILRNKL